MSLLYNMHLHCLLVICTVHVGYLVALSIGGKVQINQYTVTYMYEKLHPVPNATLECTAHSTSSGRNKHRLPLVSPQLPTLPLSQPGGSGSSAAQPDGSSLSPTLSPAPKRVPTPHNTEWIHLTNTLSVHDVCVYIYTPHTNVELFYTLSTKLHS